MFKNNFNCNCPDLVAKRHSSVGKWVILVHIKSRILVSTKSWWITESWKKFKCILLSERILSGGLPHCLIPTIRYSGKGNTMLRTKKIRVCQGLEKKKINKLEDKNFLGQCISVCVIRVEAYQYTFSKANRLWILKNEPEYKLWIVSSCSVSMEHWPPLMSNYGVRCLQQGSYACLYE